MGYFLQKLAEEADKKTLRQRAGEAWASGKKKAGEIWESGKGKVKNYAQKAVESKPGQFVKNNPKKVIGGAAGTAAALGLFAGRNKIKRALGYGESED